MSKHYTIESLIDELIGNIYPTGDAGEDERRYMNFEELLAVTTYLLSRIENVRSYEHSGQDSIVRIVKRAQEYTDTFLKEDNF